MAPRVAIVDYGMGNLYSVQLACAAVGLDARITSAAGEVRGADGVVLPGVGGMPEAMKALGKSRLDHALIDVVLAGTPLLGVCLGLQLLMTDGTEFEPHKGLGIIPGTVIRFTDAMLEGRRRKIPHVGWSEVRRAPGTGNLWSGTPLQGSEDGICMYFVHSYFVVPGAPGLEVARTSYGDTEFCSALAQGNVFGCQFHPERSGVAGLRIYKRFASLVASRGS